MPEFMTSMLTLMGKLTSKYANKKLTVSKLDVVILRYPDKTVISFQPDKESSDISVIMVDILRSTADMIKNMDAKANITITEKVIN